MREREKISKVILVLMKGSISQFQLQDTVEIIVKLLEQQLAVNPNVYSVVFSLLWSSEW